MVQAATRTTEALNQKCHNCRRQRLRCDRSYPHCNKCLRAGKECLGYGQLFRWTGAVASRGKLAGKTSSADAVRQPARTEANSSSSSSSRRTSPASSPAREAEVDDWQLVPHGRIADEAPPSPYILADPLVQDLSQSYRYYLSHFTNQVCKDLVSFDVADRNPFRSLVPLTRDNPILQHILVAAAAAHMSNLIRPSLPALTLPGSGIITPTTNEASRLALRDALVAKHKALRLMYRAVENVETVGADVVLAASLFFINLELIESGKHGWKAHLEGAGRIMSLLGPTEGGPTNELRDYMSSDCFSYFVMASAFTPPTSTVQTYFESSQIPVMLGRATANSYLCCPPQVLEILYAAAQLSNVIVEDEDVARQVGAAGMDLLRQAQTLDIPAWAIDALNIPYLKDIPLESRIKVGTSHRLAACLYIIQAIEPVHDIVGPGLAAELNRQLLDLLVTIPPKDPNYKATSWPSFIAGAGAKDTESRIMIMDRLQTFVRLIPWGFLYTAMEALQMIWSLDSSGTAEKCWIQILKDPKMNFLIV
ncbi:acriflavine sensitivity control protein acr-2 [Emericellopsis atlantica]|uniref:Acriflavine sensitivity control protein acr-2 n=1 Tax=Emericellopsis atlantica TaxID=2614577 RepID=A0A9P8CSF3_9HYPO|nr:acriflavine sensitivity control protein acr-2 [Emericellopsis atlantica]KAG9257758.1 acriflavine sensitivity control protein acr-2 [Emericellopsis atlantica]